MDESVGKRAGVPERVDFLFIPHTHWDREWYLPLERFRYRLIRVLDGLMDILEQDPSYQSFHFDGQTIPLRDYEQIQGRSERLRKLLRDGRIKVGPWYVLPDEFLVSGEALIRNLEEGSKVCREFGVAPVQVGYLPDMFGHVAEMPQIFAGFGFSSAVVWRGAPAAIKSNEFTWESPDGSRVFTAFLPLGYGIAAGLPHRPDLLITRLTDLVTHAEIKSADPVYLLLCGTDHTPPDPSTPQDLAAAISARPGWTFEWTTLEKWLERLHKLGDPPSIHRGEMRSAERTLILPGVASARLYLKRLDFLAGAGLTRYAEPLAGLAMALGGKDARGFLDYAWRLLLENHPHDSICGCSVDEVHDEMEVRFHKVLAVADQVISESVDHALAAMGGRGPRLAVYQPDAGPGPAVAVGELEGKLKRDTALVSDDGAECPLQVLGNISPPTTIIDTTISRAAAMAMLGQLAAPEISGLFVHQVKLAGQGEELEIAFEVGASPAGFRIEKRRPEIEAALSEPSLKRVRVKVKKLARQRVAVMVPHLPGCGLKSFELSSHREPGRSGLQVGPGLMENEAVKVQFEPGGTCLVTDKAAGLAYRCLRILDVGDRGDSYNFDPVPEDSLLCEPDKVALKALTAGPVAAVMEIRHRFRVPESLHTSRLSRSRKRVALDLATWVTIYRGCPRVDFRTNFVNLAKDHRLQVAVRFPYETEAIQVESAFGLVTRPITAIQPPQPLQPGDLVAQILGREGVYPTSPQKTVTLASNGESGLAIMNRGLAEVEAVKLEGATRIAMTMVRAVGYLSRGDLIMRPGDAGPFLAAPGAQCLRPFTWEYAVMPFRAGQEAEAVAAAHAFAYPPRLYLLNGQGREGEKELKLAGLTNPRVQLSALRPRPGGEILLRLVNYSRQPEACTLSLGKWWAKPRAVDLKGDPIEAPELTLGEDSVRLRLRPGQIFTLHLQSR